VPSTPIGRRQLRMRHGSSPAGASSNILPRPHPHQGGCRRQRPAVTLQTPPTTTPPERPHHGNPQPKPAHREHRHRRPTTGLQRAASCRIPSLLEHTSGGSVEAARGPAPRVPVRRGGRRLFRPESPWGPCWKYALEPTGFDPLVDSDGF
jgi:hypothetical protein